MRVEDDLKLHNQETIKNIMKLYETSHRCCAIQATGTGKTYLILRLLEIFNDQGKKAIIFAPNKEIIRQTKNKMEQFNLNNATFYTYQKLPTMSQMELNQIECDLIIMDELHRTGATKWGVKFEYLVNSHPDAYVFGATATNFRCCDSRDMAEEYFENNKACNISLAEAIVRGIIPVAPLYISALYTFDEEYNNMASKIDKSKNTVEEKINLINQLKVAKQKLEKSNGVPEIIRKYITNYDGKYVVFCQNKKHLTKMIPVVKQWFKDAGYNGKIYTYPYYSNCKTVNENLEKFKKSNRKGLKLLFVIDSLNEGMHLNVIHGCILLRSTTSNIIYYQQIGRAIDAGSNEKRVILDLVSNFSNLKTASFKRDIEQACEKRKNGEYKDCFGEFDIDNFNIKDLAQQPEDIFNQIDKNIITDIWTDSEIDILTTFYDQCTMDELVDKLPNRTPNAIRKKASLLGLIDNSMRWTEEEKLLFLKLLKKYGTDSYLMIPGKSKRSCQKMQYRMGITLDDNLKKNCSDFSKEEDDFLIANFPKIGCECAEKLGRKENQIKYRAAKLGLSYHKKTKYVTYIKRINKYHVRFIVNGDEKRFGYFDTFEEARCVAMEKAKEYGKAI